MNEPDERAPAVSVVIPAYNAERFIGEAVNSVLEQTYRDFEVIVVDDGSTDKTAEVVKTCEEVRYLYKENGGTASARNRGVEASRGHYVAFLDADNLWEPEKLEVQIALFERQPSLVWSYTDSLLVDEEKEQPVYRKSQLVGHPEGDVLERLIHGNFMPPSTVVVARDVLKEMGGFDESNLHRISEGWELWTRIAGQYPVGYVHRPLTKTRQHAYRKTDTMDLKHAYRSRKAIVEKAVRRDQDRLGGRRRSALASLCLNTGRRYLDREERAAARRFFWQALRYRPVYLAAWMYLGASFIPRSLLRSLGWLRALLRGRT